MKNIFQNKGFIIIATLIVGIVIGWVIFSSPIQTITTSSHQDINTSEVWTCSMHPSIRQSEPGKCPICGMDLIPLGNDDDGGDPKEVRMSETAMKLANIQTTIIGVGNSVKEVRLNGKVQADERRKSSQAAHIPGRIEQLLVNFTGEYVQKGQTIAQIYSPELVTAQQELFEANKIKDAQPELFTASREKLKNWKLTDKQIDNILATGKPLERFPIHADASGVVLERRVSVGDYVMRGAPIYDVADLSNVWILFDVYENDIPWVKKNSVIEFTVQSLPGEKFTKKISFIDPIINPATRVASARVEMSNPGLRLKPEMFTSAIVKSDLKSGKDVIVPKSAVMWTGERSVVYLKKMSDAGVSFRMTEVTLGPSLGDAYIINEGLRAGQEVVTNGTFTIDAAAQLAGKPSMMSPEGGKTSTGHNHGDMGGSESKEESSQATENTSLQMKMDSEASKKVSEEFKKQIRKIYTAQLELQEAFIATDAVKAKETLGAVEKAIGSVNMKLVSGEAHKQWMASSKTIGEALNKIRLADDIEGQRIAYSDFSDELYKIIKMFGITGEPIYYQFCPMAENNKGAYWLSATKEIKNPYFGEKMLRCGETKEIIK